VRRLLAALLLYIAAGCSESGSRPSAEKICSSTIAGVTARGKVEAGNIAIDLGDRGSVSMPFGQSALTGMLAIWPTADKRLLWYIGPESVDEVAYTTETGRFVAARSPCLSIVDTALFSLEVNGPFGSDHVQVLKGLGSDPWRTWSIGLFVQDEAIISGPPQQ
jgi:hypothetical protein